MEEEETLMDRLITTPIKIIPLIVVLWWKALLPYVTSNDNINNEKTKLQLISIMIDWEMAQIIEQFIDEKQELK